MYGRWNGLERKEPVAAPILTSTRVDADAYLSPGGDKLVFMSNRNGGDFEIWTSYADGSSPKQITNFAGATGTARWSPNGSKIVFDARTEGDSEIFIMDPDGRGIERLTDNDINDNMPNWSRDGKFIYFSSDRSGEFEVWKMPAEGGNPIQITQGGGMYANESHNGNSLFYTTGRTGGIMRVPRDGGPAEVVVDQPVFSQSWTLTEDSVLFIAGRKIIQQNLDTGEASEIEIPESPPVIGLSISPAGDKIYFGTDARSGGADIHILEGIR